MIESIKITNFYCFKDTTEVSFVAGRERSKANDELYCGYSTLNRVNLLKTIYLYGDNAAGKTKFLKAFDVLQQLVTTYHDDKTESLPYYEFALDPEKQPNQPSSIELVYHFDTNRYRYFISWNSQVILEESLTLLRVASEAKLYHRWHNENERVAKVEFSKEMNMNDDTVYMIKGALLRNNSVISSITSVNMYNKVLHDQLSFFRHGIKQITLSEIDLGDMLPDEKEVGGSELKQVILSLLSSIGSNIVDYEKTKVPRILPSLLRQGIKGMNEEENRMIQRIIDMSPTYAVKIRHDVGLNEPLPLDLEVQSEGTKEILRIILCMHEAISEHKTIILDDCINGIHPKTMEQMMKFYLGASVDSQLIIASQNFSNLDDKMLRRDSLRFVIKDNHGVSKVEQMNLGDLHKNQNLRLQVETSGRWGVKPPIYDWILEETIHEYTKNMADSSDNYFSELF